MDKLRERARGIFPALITPYNNNKEIAVEVLKKLINRHLKIGVSGFYVGGSTSEAFMLSLEERKLILKTVIEEVKNKAVVIAHVGCISTDQAIELAEHAEQAGADAISSIPPFYYDFTLEEIKGYYYDLMDAVKLPMIIYNYPANSGVDLNSDNSQDLFEKDQVFGVKYTSSDLYKMERIKNIDNKLHIFNGHDENFLGGLAMGADGAIGSTYNIMADKFIEIQKLFNEGKMEKARKIQIEANDIIDVLIEVGVKQGVKYLIEKEYGFTCGGCRQPFKGLDSSGIQILESLSD